MEEGQFALVRGMLDRATDADCRHLHTELQRFVNASQAKLTQWYTRDATPESAAVQVQRILERSGRKRNKRGRLSVGGEEEEEEDGPEMVVRALRDDWRERLRAIPRRHGPDHNCATQPVPEHLCDQFGHFATDRVLGKTRAEALDLLLEWCCVGRDMKTAAQVKRVRQMFLYYPSALFVMG